MYRKTYSEAEMLLANQRQRNVAQYNEKMVYIRYEKSTESGWCDWGFLSVKKEFGEDAADEYEDEVQDEDLAG